jgi:hypothetical protein
MFCISRDKGMETKNASVQIYIPRTDQLTVVGRDNAGGQSDGRHRNSMGHQMKNRLVMREGGCPNASAARPRGSV